MVKKEKLFASQGGPIILAQIENEYGNIMSAYGDAGKPYIHWCGNFAESLDIGVPWVMCQQYSDAPSQLLTHVMVSTVTNSTLRIIAYQRCGQRTGLAGLRIGVAEIHIELQKMSLLPLPVFINTVAHYKPITWFYHGGTNFGRYSGGPYIATTYDYDAPLDEYGNMNQPKWGHLKQLHNLLMHLEKVLTHGEVNNTDYGNMMSSTVYALNGQRVCFFGNANDKNDITITFEGKNYTTPAWSVSILLDCLTEVYNTAQVNTQTSIVTKKPSETDKASKKLEWSWRAEKPQHFKDPSNNPKGITYATQLLEQKAVTDDTSDYLWYMTSVDIDENDPIWGEEVTLQVHTNGHVLHAFVNGKHIGSEWAKDGDFKFVFEQIAKMKHGKKNTISLLSVTVGLQNYGAYLDKVDVGILGPLKLIAPNSQEKNLSTNIWAYKVGLNGMERRLYEDDMHKHRNWSPDDLPFNRPLIWYKTTFQAPSGEDPVVLDLLGLGKGIAWVNGHNIGLYWPSYLADENGCSDTCDYRGAYYDKKCLTNCGKPSQRWYHVPRSFLRERGNTLVLFEELGGNRSNVNVQTVTMTKAFANAYEGSTLELSCRGGRVISEVKFASFGDPKGTYGSLQKGSCESPNSLSVIEKACVGKESCSIDVSEGTFEHSGCGSIQKRLAVEAVC
ncbi:hypothetical protein RJ639_009797 [Escallonia herrerae]|uniref:Beta-galactosidase n=1 Tax=Escallonia herrerae TaxID=1293975 RepID=A0AA88VR08_9ASTE|nr:hypothetical protein RJ639_010725 [Escallonia herrerae]KAK3013706.1 hypothetical protein RJ639_009797 [Escallonia herrerae]